VRRIEPGRAWSVAGEASGDGNGLLRFTDRDVVAGRRYGYQLAFDGVPEGDETWVDVPVASALAIRAVRQAGSSGIEVEFAVPGEAPARIDVFDLAGRRVASGAWAGLEAGIHRRTIGGFGRSGVVFLRLEHAGQVATARTAVTR